MDLAYPIVLYLFDVSIVYYKICMEAIMNRFITWCRTYYEKTEENSLLLSIRNGMVLTIPAVMAGFLMRLSCSAAAVLCSAWF